MIIYYLDASVWIKRYYREMGTDWIETLFANNPPISCASLGLIEVLATLVRKRSDIELWQGAQQCGFSVVNPEEEDRRSSASTSSPEKSELDTSQ